eukprot:3825865-Karenia_brevis.AAC.1
MLGSTWAPQWHTVETVLRSSCAHLVIFGYFRGYLKGINWTSVEQKKRLAFACGSEGDITCERLAAALTSANPCAPPFAMTLQSFIPVR